MNKASLSIILPIHNERQSLEQVIASWHAALKELPDCGPQFLACEDGSTDGTQELLIELAKRYPLIDLSVQHRRGYGKAVLDGIHAAKGDYLLCIDSDGQCSPENFADFWRQRENSDFIIGWRKPRRDPFIRRIYSKMFFVAHKILFLSPLHDPSCPFVLAAAKPLKNLSPI